MINYFLCVANIKYILYWAQMNFKLILFLYNAKTQKEERRKEIHKKVKKKEEEKQIGINY